MHRLPFIQRNNFGNEYFSEINNKTINKFNNLKEFIILIQKSLQVVLIPNYFSSGGRCTMQLKTVQERAIMENSV